VVNVVVDMIAPIGRRKEEGGRRKEEGGRRKEEGGRRKEEGGRRLRLTRHHVLLYYTEIMCDE
jgi:hypothetical protein